MIRVLPLERERKLYSIGIRNRERLREEEEDDGVTWWGSEED